MSDNAIQEVEKLIIETNAFDTNLHQLKKSADGSYTAYSQEYDEHYHSTKDGALKESLVKHVEPAFKIKSYLDEVNILDICFGLGFNTLATLFYIEQNNLTCKVNIYSPELDEELITSLKNFIYPKEFDELRDIIEELINKQVYKKNNLHIELFLGDAREYVREFENFFDIVYQDAFSPKTNPILWTKEYFNEIKKSMKKDGVLTTYSTALATRLALYQNGFNLYLNSGEEYRNATVASQSELAEFSLVDMEHKISCNPHVEPLRD